MTALNQYMLWLQACLNQRINHYFEGEEQNIILPAEPSLEATSPIEEVFTRLQLGKEEKLIVLLALAPHLQPHLLDVFFTNNSVLNKPFTEFGGIRGKQHAGFLPTKETAVFLIAGNDLSKRVNVMEILHPDQRLFSEQILEINSSEAGEPAMSSALSVSKIFLPKILWNKEYIPHFGADFPAKRVNTNLDWDDLVLAPFVMEEVMEIKSWVEHEQLIQESWGLKKMVKPGYRALFHGPPGTGKTLTASLLGKALDKEVYRIDLAMTISKYIGETEKNLAKVFDLAEYNDWILFFDEADALFGKRTITQSSNDRYANQEVSYLLQRIEDFPGLTILASNFKSNIDDAFARRFQSMIYFPAPDVEQRLQLWQKAFANGPKLARDIDLAELAQRYELSGGEIINVLRYVAIQAARNPEQIIHSKDIIKGIRKEFHKNDRTLSS